MSVLAILETLPNFEAIKAEREHTGDGLMVIKARHQKAAMMQAIAAAKTLDDIKIILARLVEKTRCA